MKMIKTEPKIFWEDIVVGQAIRFGSRSVSAQEIVEFAREFDPQPFHLDETAAKESLLGGLAASGWHTCGMLMAMICEEFLHKTAGMGSPGLDEVRWLRPVRPDDVLTAQQICLESRRSASRPEMGICKYSYEVFNQHGEPVMSWVVTQLFRCRNQAPDSDI
ncbi:MAG: MaoC family dehydratase [Alphaproteobacteria bacterium]